MDEVLALPTERAARIALRTQQVIAHETGVANVADPLGGSWFVEELTDEMERQAEAVFAHLDELGDGSILEGVYLGIDGGYFQDEIAEAAYDFDRKVSSGRRIVVGVNAYEEGNEEDPPPTLRVGQEVEDIQLKRLGEVRQARSADAVEVALASVREDARDPVRNLMEPIGEAVRAYATVGEIMGALAAVFGRWQEVSRV